MIGGGSYKQRPTSKNRVAWGNTEGERQVVETLLPVFLGGNGGCGHVLRLSVTLMNEAESNHTTQAACQA